MEGGREEMVSGLRSEKRERVEMEVRATPMQVVKNGGDKCNFVILNSVLVPLNIFFAPMVGVKMGCHFNN